METTIETITESLVSLKVDEKVYYTNGDEVFSLGKNYDVPLLRQWATEGQTGETEDTAFSFQDVTAKRYHWKIIFHYLNTGRLVLEDVPIEHITILLKLLGIDGTTCSMTQDGNFDPEYIKLYLEEIWFKRHHDVLADPNNFLLRLDQVVPNPKALKSPSLDKPKVNVSRSHPPKIAAPKKIRKVNKKCIIKKKSSNHYRIINFDLFKQSNTHNLRPMTLWKDFPLNLLGDKIFVAGGSITGAVGGRYYQDIDLFLVCKEEEAMSIIIELMKTAKDMSDVMLTSNSISFYVGLSRTMYQIILRVYKSKAEIITGFDIDCCCALWDGTYVWITPRCLYSWVNACNTINLDLLSTTYEPRLEKYLTRGFDVITFMNIKSDVLFKAFNNSKKVMSWDSNEGSLKILIPGKINAEVKICNGLLALLIISLKESYLKIVSDYEIGENKYMIILNNKNYIPIDHPNLKIKFESMNLKNKCDVDIIKSLKLKIRNPGEQISGSFHKLVLDDPKLWYDSKMTKGKMKERRRGYEYENVYDSDGEDNSDKEDDS